MQLLGLLAVLLLSLLLGLLLGLLLLLLLLLVLRVLVLVAAGPPHCNIMLLKDGNHAAPRLDVPSGF